MQFTTSRRQFLLVSAGLGSLAVLNACAPKAEPTAVPEAPKEEPTAAPAEAVKLQMMWRTNPDEQAMTDDLLDLLKEKRPDIELEVAVSPWDEFEPKLMANYAGGIAPDVIGTGGTNPYVERYYRKMVLELDPYAEKSPEMINGLWPVGLDSYTINGKLIAMTFTLCNAGVFINATRYEEAGVDLPPASWDDASWTWDALIANAKELTLDSDGDGKIDRYGFNAGHSSAWTYTRLWGGDIVSDEDYGAGIMRKLATDVQANYDALVGGLQARADVVYKHEVGPDPATSSALNQMGSMLKTGAIAMDFTGGWAIWGELPEDFKFAAAPNPIGGANGSGTRVNNCWAEPLQICSQTKNPDASWDFVEFYTFDEDAVLTQMNYRTTIPARMDMMDRFVDSMVPKLAAMSPEDVKTYFEGAISVAETTVPCHILSGWAAGRDAMHASLDPVWTGDKQAAEVIDQMIDAMNAKYDENAKALGL